MEWPDAPLFPAINPSMTMAAVTATHFIGPMRRHRAKTGNERGDLRAFSTAGYPGAGFPAHPTAGHKMS
jgi:hypothetical protein